MFGAVAAGADKGGFDDIIAAAKVLGKVKDYTFKPQPENVEIYQKLYQEYRLLHDYFGRTEHIMKRLKAIKESVKGVCK